MKLLPRANRTECPLPTFRVAPLRVTAWLLTALLVTALPVVSGTALAKNQDYQTLPFTLDRVKDRIVPVDMDGDGLNDLLTADNNRLQVYFQRSGEGVAPFDFSRADAVLDLPGNATGWAIDNLAGEKDGSAGKRIVALGDANQVLAWTLQDRDFSEAKTLLEQVPGFLPAGAYPMNFIRDINGDGLNDLIVPGHGELQLYLQKPRANTEHEQASHYDNGLRIQSRISIVSRLSPGANLTDRVGQRVRIPEMRLRDLNNDQRKDLIASSEERVDVFLADEVGGFALRPSYSIDLGELQKRVGEVDVDRVDYSNLSGLLAHTYNFQLEDVDGDGIDDLLIREGGKLTLFGGTPTGMNMDKPRQILKSSGNVLGTTLRDEDGDGLKDLWLIRIQDISLGNLFLWLAVSGSVDIESFVYKNEGERFASRPHRKVTVSIKFPSILRSMNMVTNAAEPESRGEIVRTVRARLEGGPSRRDIVVLQQETLAVFINVIEKQDGETFLGLPDYRLDKNNYVYDLGKILENPSSGPNGDLEKVTGREPNRHINFGDEFTPDLNRADLFAWDMNNDGRDDFFVMSEREETSVSGLLVLSR
ncbi:MAG: VCBS repeat-containing protein [Cellvibrionaceae bacterium]